MDAASFYRHLLPISPAPSGSKKILVSCSIEYLKCVLYAVILVDIHSKGRPEEHSQTMIDNGGRGKRNKLPKKFGKGT